MVFAVSFFTSCSFRLYSMENVKMIYKFILEVFKECVLLIFGCFFCGERSFDIFLESDRSLGCGCFCIFVKVWVRLIYWFFVFIGLKK